MNLAFREFRIRDWVAEDAPSIVIHADNPKVAMNLRDGFPSPYGPADAEAFLAMVEEQNPRTYFAIARADEVVGSIGYSMGKDVYRFTAELGYWLAEPYWNRGIATEAITLLVDWVFRHEKINRIHAGVYGNNHASMRVL